jgi:hypothetical protein
MAQRLTDVSEWERPGWIWSPEQESVAQAYHEAVEAGGIASGLVFIWTRYGLEKTASFIGQAAYSREQLRTAAAALKRVGTFPLLAQVVDVAAALKPRTPPSWRSRINAKHRRRRK